MIKVTQLLRATQCDCPPEAHKSQRPGGPDYHAHLRLNLTFGALASSNPGGGEAAAETGSVSNQPGMAVLNSTLPPARPRAVDADDEDDEDEDDDKSASLLPLSTARYATSWFLAWS